MKGITEVGFPCIVALYLLVRNEKKLESFKDAVVELTSAVKELSAKVR